MSKLTSRLADLIATDNAILFVGNALRASHAPPAIEQIAEALAARIEYQRPDRSLSAVARDYEILKGRNALITALREETRKLQLELKTDPIHQLIADAVLPHTKVLTTRFDQILERALDQFQKPYVLIVRDADVPFFDEAKITLIKMQGDIDQPDSLIITEDDLDDFIRRLPTISDVVRAFFATKTLIFLGYDLNSPLFKRFYNQVTRNLSAFRRQAYAIVPARLDPVEDKYWAAQNVETIEENPLQFLEALAAAVKAEIQVKRDPEPTNRLLELQKGEMPTRPYKALDSFTTADAALFSGRTEESQRLANRILAHRLTLLYGESGSGKSSLLHAGVTPRLLQQRSLVATCTPTPDQPLTEIMRRALLETGQRAGLTPPSESLLVTIREWQRTLSGPLVLVLDQFEQFFLVYNPQERTTAARLFHELHEDRSLNLRLVFILREDFLGRLQTLEDLVPGLMNVRFRLEKLGRENARAALEEPARLFNAQWEPALVQTLLDELITDDGDISPPQLQLVADQLWQDASKNNPDRAGLLTLARFTELGGVQTILGDYLDQTVTSFPEPDQPHIRTLLGVLVSSGGVKQRLPLPEISRATDLPPEKAAELLDQLTSLRLLQRYETPNSNSSSAPFDYANAPEDRFRSSLRVLPTNQPTDQPINRSPIINHQSPITQYELTHDYLVPRITRWLGQDFWDAQKAREIIRQDFPAWQTRQRLLAIADLKILNTHHTTLRLTPAEAEMVFASAVAHDEGISLWQKFLPESEAMRVLLTLLMHPDVVPRTHAAAHLAHHPNPMVALALADTALKDPAAPARTAATHSLAHLIGDAPKTLTQPAIDALLAAHSNSNSNSNSQLSNSHLALTTLRDLQPATDALLPNPIRGQITRKVWQLRFNRHRGELVEMILQGLQGGFLALGLGMGIFFGLGSAQDLSILPFLRILGLVYFGISIAGVLGATNGAMVATNQAIFKYILDGQRPFIQWLSGTFLSAGIMAISFLFLSGIFPGTPRVGVALAAGALIGAGLTAPAIAPYKLPWVVRFVISAVSGIIAFLLGNQLLFNQAIIWAVLMGLAGGIGFFLAFNWKRI
ncbi:MAG: hypothetical protein Fur0022_22930 [Anaerolineales bacterium]